MEPVPVQVHLGRGDKMSHLERITSCEHGQWNPHATDTPLVLDDGSLNRDNLCRGAIRREVVVDYEAAESSWEASRDTLLSDAEMIHLAVDAALGGLGEET